MRFGIQRLFAEAPRKDCRLGLRSQGVAHHRIDHRNGTAATTRTAIQSAPKAAPPAGEIPDLGLGADNGTRYGGREFKKAVQAPGMRHGFGFVSVKCDSCDFDMGYGEYVRYVAHKNSTYSDILGDYAKGAKGQSPGTLDEWD